MNYRHLQWTRVQGVSQGHLQWPRVQGVTQGHLQWTRVQGVSQGHLQWPRVQGVSQGHLQWPRVQGVNQGHLQWTREAEAIQRPQSKSGSTQAAKQAVLGLMVLVKITCVPTMTPFCISSNRPQMAWVQGALRLMRSSHCMSTEPSSWSSLKRETH